MSCVDCGKPKTLREKIFWKIEMLKIKRKIRRNDGSNDKD